VVTGIAQRSALLRTVQLGHDRDADHPASFAHLGKGARLNVLPELRGKRLNEDGPGAAGLDQCCSNNFLGQSAVTNVNGSPLTVPPVLFAKTELPIWAVAGEDGGTTTTTLGRNNPKLHFDD
jgi:hypothetical protein